MDVSRKFLRFAAECEVMAKMAPDKENKLVWRRLADRWLQCVGLYEGLTADRDSLIRRHQKSAHSWVH
jgi:hypothetical protein